MLSQYVERSNPTQRFSEYCDKNAEKVFYFNKMSRNKLYDIIEPFKIEKQFYELNMS